MSNITIFISAKRHWLVLLCREVRCSQVRTWLRWRASIDGRQPRQVGCKRGLLCRAQQLPRTKKDRNGLFGGSGGRCSQVRAWLRWRASNDGRQPRHVGCKRSLLVQEHNNSHATKKDPSGSFWWKRWELNPRPKSETKAFLHV